MCDFQIVGNFITIPLIPSSLTITFEHAPTMVKGIVLSIFLGKTKSSKSLAETLLQAPPTSNQVFRT